MKKIRSSHLIVGAAALLMVLAAGTVSASNMAFKINIELPRPVTTGITGNQCTLCDTWISLPFSNPLIGNTLKLRALCDTDGSGTITTADQMQFVSQQGKDMHLATADPSALDSVTTHSCTVLTSPNPVYQPTRAVRLRTKPIGTANQILTQIYVGSDVPGTQILLRNSLTRAVAGGSCNGSLCDNQVDMVYHTTATNLRQFCDTDGSGTVSTADRVQFVTLQGKDLNLATANRNAVDSVTTHSCTVLTSANPAVIVGRGLRVRLKVGSTTTPMPDTLISEPHF